jgi:hypothetical protein
MGVSLSLCIHACTVPASILLLVQSQCPTLSIGLVSPTSTSALGGHAIFPFSAFPPLAERQGVHMYLHSGVLAYVYNTGHAYWEQPLLIEMGKAMQPKGFGIKLLPGILPHWDDGEETRKYLGTKPTAYL